MEKQYKLSLLEKSVLREIRRSDGNSCPYDLVKATRLPSKDINIILEELNNKGIILTHSRCFHDVA